jgi:hypothetical protein
MAAAPKSRKDLESALILKAWKDDAFRQELLSNPKAAIEKLTGHRVPDDVQVVVHEETARTFHLCLPAKPASETGRALSDVDLETVAGGAGDMTITHTKCYGYCDYC